MAPADHVARAPGRVEPRQADPAAGPGAIGRPRVLPHIAPPPFGIRTARFLPAGATIVRLHPPRTARTLDILTAPSTTPTPYPAIGTRYRRSYFA
jgi:hypothetical protein